MFTIQEILDLAIQIEKNGEAVYRQALKTTNNPEIISLLHQLAEDEVKHIQWFTNLRESAMATVEDPAVHEMGQKILNNILGDQTFSLQEVDFSNLGTVISLLNTAIEFEKDTILFYHMLSALVQDEEGVDLLNKIIEEENRHIAALEDTLRKASM